MKTVAVRLLPLLLGGIGGLASAAEEEASPIDQLDQAALQETFRVLRSNYIERERLTLEELNRAALEGLLQRLDFGAEIVPLQAPTTAAPPPPPLVREALSERLAYLRPGSWSAEELATAAEALRRFADTGHQTLIFDLRAPAPDGDFHLAARWLSLFMPPGQELFSLQKPGDPHPLSFRSEGTPVWTGSLALLFDEETNNIGEAVAAVLTSRQRLPTFGSPTRGRTMEYQTVPLTARHGLKFASAELRLPDGTSLFRRGLTPLLPAPFDRQAKATIFAALATEGVAKFLHAPVRPRQNEASLVAGTTPDLPYLLAKSAGHPTPYNEPPLLDLVLVQAVNLLEAQAFLAR